jgi:hypothetical protein
MPQHETEPEHRTFAEGQRRGLTRADLRLSEELVLGAPPIAVQRIRDTVALTAPSPGSLRSPPSPSGGECQEVR